MSRNTKIVLIVAGALVLLCLCASGAFLAFGAWTAGQAEKVIGQSFTSEPAEVNAIAGTIADFELPPGYEPDYGMQVLSFALVGYAPGDTRGHIMLIQFPSGTNLDRAAMERQLRQATTGQNYTWLDETMQVVEQETATIRGQQVTLSVSEGETGSYRQVSSVFQGKGGPALLLIAAPTDAWDQAEVDAFIASMR